MTAEILMHIDEELNADQERELLLALGNRSEGIHAHMHSSKPHMMFIAYNPEEMCPHDLVDIASESGVHAQVIDL